MLVGKQFGPFKIEKELGSGAMGAVYRGADEKTGRAVAVKMISPALLGNETAIQRFLRESAVLKKLNHPNIARYLGSGRYHGAPFYIMEYLEGESLDKVLDRRQRVTWEEIVDWGAQLCKGLQHAHDEGVIHRDLKPSNLMLLPDGTIKLTDFGIAKDADSATLTATHSTLGTVAYMSPEQCRGAKDITFKSDLYSMGIMFYELVAGRKPFMADNPMDVFLMHVKGKCARPSTFADLPIWLDKLILQLMEKSPDDRPESATQVAEELQSIAKKVQEQSSAALDRVSKRRADRTVHDGKLDETERDVGRVLLGKKKKKTATTPIYQQNWFTAMALGFVVVLFALGFYMVFLKPPGPEALFREAERHMTKESLDDHKEARDALRDFLKHHPTHAKADQVRRWRDQLDLEMCRFFVGLSRKGPSDPPLAWDAVAAEKTGRLDEAEKLWKTVVGLKADDDANRRGWGLYAERSLEDIASSRALFRDLTAKLIREKEANEPPKSVSEAERTALDSLRRHAADDRAGAVRAIADLERLTEKSDDYRAYHLLALRLKQEWQ